MSEGDPKMSSTESWTPEQVKAIQQATELAETIIPQINNAYAQLESVYDVSDRTSEGKLARITIGHLTEDLRIILDGAKRLASYKGIEKS